MHKYIDLSLRIMFEWNQWGLQNAMSPVIEEFIYFHDYLIVILVFIISWVGYFMGGLVLKQDYRRSLFERQSLESIWTLVPALILVAVALPSLRILYRLDNTDNSQITLKILGHQWYWSYEYRDFWSLTTNNRINFDAYMVNHQDLEPGLFRLLETDNRVVLPYLMSVRCLVSRADVLHSWALPSLGVKLDAMPGRLNQTNLTSYRPGVVYGQCSEICGANHRYIPIVIEFTNTKDFIRWAMAASE